MRKISWFMLFAVVLVITAAPAGAVPAQKEWTFMVFLNADNNLDPYGVADQEEMAKIGSNDNVNIVSLIDRWRGPATLNYIEKGNVRPIKEMGELDMGDYKVLVQFVKDMVAAYPARHYALVIWNHGSGWNKRGDGLVKGISYDDHPENHITTEQLTVATGEIKRIIGRSLDILACDACLMQMVEVAWAVRRNCDYFVASEQTIPGDGYPYDDMLATLAPGTTPAAFARAMVSTYDASYAAGSQGTSDSTLSALDCARLDALKPAIDRVAQALMARDYGLQLKDALDKATHYATYENVDLGHVIDNAVERIGDPAVAAAAKGLHEAMNTVILANGSHGTMGRSQGLAIYFPPIHWGYKPEYAQLAFPRETLWDEFLVDFYKKTSTGAIIAALDQGDTGVLADFVRRVDPTCREIARHVVASVNFAVFSENRGRPSAQAEVARLIRELTAKL